jgi:hypothetical protein
VSLGRVGCRSLPPCPGRSHLGPCLRRQLSALPDFRWSCRRLSEVGKRSQDRIHFSDEFGESSLCASTCEVPHVYGHLFILTQVNRLLGWRTPSRFSYKHNPVPFQWVFVPGPITAGESEDVRVEGSRCRASPVPTAHQTLPARPWATSGIHGHASAMPSHRKSATSCAAVSTFSPSTGGSLGGQLDDDARPGLNGFGERMCTGWNRRGRRAWIQRCGLQRATPKADATTRTPVTGAAAASTRPPGLAGLRNADVGIPVDLDSCAPRLFEIQVTAGIRWDEGSGALIEVTTNARSEGHCNVADAR